MKIRYEIIDRTIYQITTYTTGQVRMMKCQTCTTEDQCKALIAYYTAIGKG